ncbi:MAG: endonuclease NucS domain-containing protein [Candidatus Heimdallarchaeaceae archaeon]
MTISNFSLLPLDSFPDLAKQLNSALGDKMILLIGRCTALFDGRIKSTLEEGDRVLLIKKDLSIIMHGPSGVKPLNWQKPNAGSISFKVASDHTLEMFTERTRTKEVLQITFTMLELAGIWHARDETSIEIIGDESDLVRYLVSHPNLIAEGFQVLKTEYQTDVGPVDIKGILNGKKVVVEVKKRKATPADAYQLKRYIEYFEEKEKSKVKGILIAPEFPKKVEAYLREHQLKAKVIHWKEIFPIIQRDKKVKIDKFFTK